MARDEENRATHGDGWSGVARYGMNKHARLNVWIPVAICEGWLVCSNTQVMPAGGRLQLCASRIFTRSRAGV